MTFNLSFGTTLIRMKPYNPSLIWLYISPSNLDVKVRGQADHDVEDGFGRFLTSFSAIGHSEAQVMDENLDCHVSWLADLSKKH